MAPVSQYIHQTGFSDGLSVLYRAAMYCSPFVSSCALEEFYLFMYFIFTYRANILDLSLQFQTGLHRYTP